MKKITEDLNGKIEAVLENKDIPIGLANGKMGLCIYFYRLARQWNNDRYGKIAERLLDEVFAQIDIVKSIDIEYGLLGIGLGINYLIKEGYVQGDENTILRDVDDEIYKQVCFPKHINDNIAVYIQALLYSCIRKQSLQKEQEYLWGELAIHIINYLHTKIEQILNDDTIIFRIKADLPLFLFALGKVYETGIYNEKIERIMWEITPLILSKYGYLDSKKLYLLWSIDKINRHIKDKRLADYCRLLASQIDLDSLLDEFRSKDIYIKTGLAGICLLMLTMEDNVKQDFEVDKFYIRAKEKMKNSLIWEMSNEEQYLIDNIGLFGYCGIALVMNETII